VRVSKVFPHAQLTVAVSYVGWIPALGMVLSLHFPEPASLAIRARIRKFAVHFGPEKSATSS
jgi:hypothetical protein